MHRAFRRVLVSGLTVLTLSVATAQAAPIGLVDMPVGAPILPFPGAFPVIFDLTGNDGVGTQDAQLIPAYGGIPNTAAVSADPGGNCFGFITGELCGTNEPGPFGLRFWEFEIANLTAGNEDFVAGFFAPGLARIFTVHLVPNSGVYFPFYYVGPTIPLFGVFSTLPFPVAIATTILDPPITSAVFSIFGNEGSTVVECPTCTPNFGVQAAVPEPATLTLLGLGLVGVARIRSRRKRARAAAEAKKAG